MASPDADVSALWRFHRITDQRGVAAAFTWRQAAGQWVIDTATMPGGGVFHYGYADSGLISLQGVTYPTGETATFTPIWDSANQWVTLAIDDAGAEGTHRRKQVSLTPSIEMGFASMAQTQIPNLVRQVRNGSGELSYRNWIVSNGTELDLYNYTAGGIDNAGMLRWLRYSNGRPVSSKIAARYFPGQPFASHTWLDESDYATDAHMRPSEMRDPDGTYTTYERDAQGNITKRIQHRPDGSEISSESTTWDEQGNPLEITDALNRVTRNEYDDAGRLRFRTVALGTTDEATWEYTYDAAGRLLQAIDANKNATDYDYDPITGQIARITEPADVPGDPRFYREFTYDAAGRPLTSADQAGRTVTYYYDGRGRPTVTSYADGSTEETIYGTGVDANLVARRKDRNGVWEVFDYDSAGRQLSAVLNPGQPDQVVRSWAYVPGKDLLASETVNGTTTAYTYDSRGRVASVIQAANATVAHINTSETWDADNVTISTDHLGRSTWSLQSPDRLRSRTVRELTAGDVSATLIGDTAQRTAALWALPPPAPNQPNTYTIDESQADVAGQPTVRKDVLGAITTQEFDKQGRTTATVVTDRFGTITRSESSYDANGNRTRLVQPRSFSSSGAALNPIVSESTYTGRNLVASQRESFTDEQGQPVVAETFFSYSPTGKVATASDPRNPAWLTRSQYGECCDRLKTLIDAAGFKTEFTYDALGRQRTTTDANLHVQETRYDAQGRVVARIDGANKQTDMVYDQDLTDGVGLDQQFPALVADLGFGPGAVGAADLTTLPTGERSVVIRDGLGRTVRQAQLGKSTSTTAPQVVTTRYDVPPVPPRNGIATEGLEGVAVTDAVNQTTTTWRDAAGRVVRIDLPSGGMMATTYDPAGNPLRQIDANGVETTLTYDGQGRVATQQVGSTGGMSRQYDAAGNVVAETDAQGITTSRVYDGFNRLIRVVHPVLGTTRMTHDLAGNLKTITDHEGGVTSYEYDERGRLRSETLPGTSGGTQRLTYNEVGNLKTRTDRRGIVTTYEYDAADRVKAKIYSTGNREDFFYDDQGRLLKATSSRYNTTVERTYDPGTGELASETQRTPVGTAQVAVAYDAQHRPQAYTLDDGSRLGQDYTPLGQVDTAKLDGVVVAKRELDAGGRLQFVTHASQVRESRRYTDGNLVERLSVTPQSAQQPALLDLSYDYDDRRRKTSEADLAPQGERQTFAFDDAGRLETWTRTPGAGGPLGTPTQSPAPANDRQTWLLSAVGDWKTTTINGTSQTRTHSPVHETTGITTGGATTALTYDANGNLTQDERGNRYAWDEENRLVSVSVRDAGEGVTSTARMTYDALGRRLTRSAFGTTTQFVLNGSQVLQERDLRRLPDGNRERASDGELPAADAPAPAGSILTLAGTRFLRHQPEAIAIPDGWIADKGRALDERTNGLTYGWQDASAAPIALAATQAVARDVMPLPQFDAFHRFTEAGTSSTWRYALENGTYAVVVVAGDAASREHTNNLHLNGFTLSDPDPYDAAENAGYVKGDFDGWAETITVTDGFLSLEVGTGSLDPTVCFVEIGPQGSTVDQALRDKLAQAIIDATNRTGGDPFRKVPTPRTFVYGGDYIDAPVAFRAGSGAQARLYGIHANSLYSVAAITDDHGMVVERYTYGPYGDRRLEGENTGFSRLGLTVGFTGLRDEEGLLFARARYFSPTLGRWISRDPAGYVDGYNLYAGYFVPNAVDPEGKFIPVLIAVGALAGFFYDYGRQAIFENAFVNGFDFSSLGISTGLGGGLGLGVGIGIYAGAGAIYGAGGAYIAGGGGVSWTASLTAAQLAAGVGSLGLLGYQGYQAVNSVNQNGWNKNSQEDAYAFAFNVATLGAFSIGAGTRIIAARTKAARMMETRGKCPVPVTGNTPSVKMDAGLTDPKYGVVLRAGFYDPDANVVFIGRGGHFDGGGAVGGTPRIQGFNGKSATPGITVIEKGDTVYWANDSMSLPIALTQNQLGLVQAALAKAFVGKKVIQAEGTASEAALGK